MTDTLLSVLFSLLLPSVFLPPALLQYSAFAPVVSQKNRLNLATGYSITWICEFFLCFYLLFAKHYALLYLYQKSYLIAWLPYLLIAMACIRPYFFRHLFLYLIRSIFVIFLNTFCFFIIHGIIAPHIPSLYSDWQYIAVMTLHICIYLALLPVLSRFFYDTFFTYSDIGTPKIWAYACLLPALLLFNNIFFVFDKNSFPLYTQYLLSRSVSVLTALLFVFSIRAALRQIHFNMEDQQRNQALSLQMQNLHSYIEALQSSKQEMYEFSLHRQHYLDRLIRLVRGHQFTQALDIIHHLDHHLDLTKRKRYCEDPILNASLVSYLSIAEKEGIPLNVHVQLPKIVFSMNTGLAMVISNLLENAIHASEKQEPQRRSLALILTIQGNMLNLLVKNRFDAKVECDSEGFPISHRHGHGIGTKSLLSFRDRYNATVFCTQKDGYFTTYVRVPYQAK